MRSLETVEGWLAVFRRLHAVTPVLEERVQAGAWAEDLLAHPGRPYWDAEAEVVLRYVERLDREIEELCPDLAALAELWPKVELHLG